jgi:hypothetical protein
VNAPAAISGSLVAMRNVGTHKSVALTIHVPEELGEQIVAAFGWPTSASPVPVAVARLNVHEKVDARPADVHEKVDKPPRRFSELPPSQQAALKCQEPAFQRFVSELTGQPPNESYTTPAMRRLLNVNSRSVLDTDPAATERWLTLLRQFDAWMAHA